MNKITAVYRELKEKLVGPEVDDSSDKLQQYYFQVFNTPSGQAVLSDMLTDLHVFAEIANDEDVVLNNYGRLLLSKIGVIRGDNTEEIVKLLMGIAKKEATKQG